MTTDGTLLLPVVVVAVVVVVVVVMAVTPVLMLRREPRVGSSVRGLRKCGCCCRWWPRLLCLL
jgi:hypothetical protein